ncbi:hypothetical protein [Aquipuribacter sp. MA13-6]|uniref:hypothetical protein n=1 Tax=unclassified Aquipuribacter TaxID=2635084 RepID=UPI003EE87B1C
MSATGVDVVASPWGPWRARLILVGLISWLGGCNFMLLNVFDEVRWVSGWFASVIGLGLAVATLLSALVRRNPTRWSFPGTVLAVPRAAGVPARVYFTVLALLAAGIPILMGVFLLRLIAD